MKRILLASLFSVLLILVAIGVTGVAARNTQQVSATPTKQASATATKQASATPTKQASPTPTKLASATPTKLASATPTQQPSATPTQQASATPTEQASATPTEPISATLTEQVRATPNPIPLVQAPALARTIKVTGNAQVMVAPDQVILTLGVESWNAKLSMAKAENDLIVHDVIGATRSFDILDKDVQTDYINIEPSYDNSQRTQITGYFVRRNVVVTLRDLTRFEDLLSASLEAGANFVHGIEFRTSDLRKYRDQARDLAIQAAQEKAQAMAGKLDQTIGEPVSIEEISNNWWSPYSSWWGSGMGGTMSQNVIQNAPGAAAQGMGQTDEALAPGQIAVSASVQVEFELK